MNNQVQTTKTHQDDDDEIDLLKLLDTLLDGKLLIFLFTLIALLLAFVYANSKTAIYKADALLQVEAKKAGIPGLEELAGLGGDDTSISTELELIKSRKTLGKAVDDLKLGMLAYPKRFPILGAFYHHIFAKKDYEKLPPIWGTFDDFSAKYAWGNEQIQLERLDVPKALLNKPLTLILKKSNAYTLFSGETLLLEGKIGRSATNKEGTVRLFVSQLTGIPDTQYTLIKQSRLTAISILQDQLKASEKGKKTGMINLVLEGSNKPLLIEILNHISNTYIDQNKTRSAEEAKKALHFLEGEIKPLKNKAETAENKLRVYKTDHTTADMLIETQNLLKVEAEIETDIQKLSFKQEELSLKYTLNHPSMRVVLSQIGELKKKKKRIEKEKGKLPVQQQELLGLERDFKVANILYHDLNNKIQEFKIAEASSIGNAYLIDKAVVFDAVVKPKKSLILAIGTILGLMLGIVTVFLRKALHQMVDDPEQLELVTGIPVYATVPLSTAVSLTRGLRDRKKQKSLLALDHPDDPAIESLRSLRTSLHFALMEAKNNIVMITGPSPEIGKSFISSNFAAVLSSSEQRVLLIDADMRKGYLHNLLNVGMSPGLSGLITQKHTLEETIHTIKLGNNSSMDVITRGQTPPNPSELLMHSHFETLLNQLSSRYDLILIDTPPVHAVTDPVIIGAFAGVTFMVARYNQHAMKEIEHAIQRLSQTGIETKGFIFNAYVPKKRGGSYGYQSYYGEYKSN